MSKPHILVIGSGINGLVASNYLRRAGLSVTLIDRASVPGGACISAEACVDGVSQKYSLGASVLGLMPDFIFNETGLAKRLKFHVPTSSKLIYFGADATPTNIFRDPNQLQQELFSRWGERGQVAAFREDEAKVTAYLQRGYREANPPSLRQAREVLGEPLTSLWISGSAFDLLNHYFTSEKAKCYMGMTVTESGPVSLHAAYSAFTIPLMDSGSVFDGYYGYVAPGLWRLPEELARINAELGIDTHLETTAQSVDLGARTVHCTERGQERSFRFDHLVFATDPVTAARLSGNDRSVKETTSKRFRGASGKITMLFRKPVRWLHGANDDGAFRFIFSVESLHDFESSTLRVFSSGLDYSPGYIQIYCEGQALRAAGDPMEGDRLTLFFNNLRLGKTAAELPEIEETVRAEVFRRIVNPEDFAWSRMLTPRDIKELFLFPEGNIDHMMLTEGQTFSTRRFGGSSERFYGFGDSPYLWYCGAGSYPCGSIAGTPGYMCATELLRATGNARKVA